MADRHLLDVVAHKIRFSQAVVVSTLPRGGVHIVQPANCPDSMVKAYTRDAQREDRVAWTALTRGTVVRARDCWTAEEFADSPYLHGFLNPHGLRYVAAIPVSSVVLDGYPGAVLLFRGPDENDFTDVEVAAMRGMVDSLNDFLIKSRPARNTELAVHRDPWTHTAQVRVCIYDSDAKVVFPSDGLDVDSRVREQLDQHAKEAVAYCRRGQLYADRLLLPDARGELWVFHCAVYRDYPALGHGPVAFFCLQPECFEWVAVRPADIAAQDEMVRLLPAIKFMQQEFGRLPMLHETADLVHLSPFHFHRRFTELFGQTPKHFLLSCQTYEAKRLLASRRRELARIASDCGFAHQSHFTSRFKQATGLTPTRWRSLADEIVQNGRRA